MRINTNLVALNTKNQLNKNNKTTANIMEKLSSGKRINKAADDAAGLAISQKMRAQIRGLNQADENVQDGISLIQTAEGALNEMEDMTQRMRELSVQGANDTLTTEDREKIQKELDALKKQIDVIANTTEFNTRKLLNGDIQTEMKSVSKSIDLNIPLDGSIVSTSIDIEGETIDLNFTDDLLGNTVVNIEESGDILTSEILEKKGKNGILEWEKNYGANPSDEYYTYDRANAIYKTSDGGYILTGPTNSYSDVMESSIKKFDQNHNLEWEKKYSEKNYNSIKQTSDGGYIVAGTSYETFFDFTALRLKANGETQWDKTFSKNSIQRSNSVIEDKDGNFLLLGTAGEIDGLGDYDMKLLKFNDSGTLLWEKLYGGSIRDSGVRIIEASDNGYILAGSTSSIDGDISDNNGNTDYWITKINLDGTISWSNTYGGSSNDYLTAITATSDGGYVIGGKSFSDDGDIDDYVGSRHGWIAKINKDGVLQWDKSNDEKYIYDIKETHDKGFVVVGEIINEDPSGSHDTYDSWIAKMNVNGNLEWEKTYGGSKLDRYNSVIEYKEGEYIAVGTTSSNDGDISGDPVGEDWWLSKINEINEIDYDVKENFAVNKNLDNNYITIDNIELIFENNKYENLTGLKANYTLGSDNGLIIQAGANAGQTVKIGINDMRSEALGMINGYPKVTPRENAEISIEISDEAIRKLSNERSRLGAKQNRLEHISKNLANSSENLQNAESRITDADMAKQAMKLAKNDVLIQATQSMLAQANNIPQSVLQLLK